MRLLLLIHDFTLCRTSWGLIANPLLFSLNFNIVSKKKGSARMSYYLNEAANDMRDLLLPTLESPKAKL